MVGWFPAQLRSCRIPSPCDCFVSVSALTIVRAEGETGFCCLHCKKGSCDDFCFMVAAIRNRTVAFLFQLLSSRMNSVAGSLTHSRW